MKKFLKYVFLIGLISGFSACADQLDEQLVDPNNLTPDKVDVNFVTNQVLQGLNNFYVNATIPGQDLSRIMALTGGDTYQNAYQPESFNPVWSSAYQSVIVQANLLESVVTGKGLDHHLGIAKVSKAYVYLTLVDMFGDVPFTNAARANEGSEFFNPTIDKGADIYAGAIKLLDEAITHFGVAAPTQTVSRDIFYSGNRTRWAAFARTIKLKALLNRQLVNAGDKAAIETLLKEDIIDTEAESFFYKYSTNIVPSNSRSGYYRQYYTPNEGQGTGYINNFYMLSLLSGKSVEDPRWRFYLYRQTGSIDKALEVEPKAIDCLNKPRPAHISAKQSWCAFEPGFLGRDHGNNDGINPDGKAITCVGVYPYGGRADVTPLTNLAYQGLSKEGQGAGGAGIEPIWMHFFTDFLKAEAYQRLGITGDAKASLRAGVTKSIEYVKAFATSKGQTVPANLVTPTASYVDEVDGLFDAANADKMQVIAKEYWLALYGNGIEAYNLYRRTGKPNDLQPMRNPSAGNYVYSFLYPANFINLNSSGAQKSNTGVNRVFWDNTNSNLK
jgi:hypothetical protein